MLETDNVVGETKPNQTNPIPPIQMRAIHLLAAGERVTAIAEKLNVSRCQIWAWRQKPEFCVALDGEVQKFSEHSRLELQSLASKSVDALRDCLQSKNESVKLRAASAVLDRLVPDATDDSSLSAGDRMIVSILSGATNA